MGNAAADDETKDVSLHKSLNKIAKEAGLEEYTINIKEVSPDGNNYLAALREVTIKSTNNEKKQLDLFVKLNSSPGMEILSISEVYNRETFAGVTLSKLYEDLQEEAKIPHDERYKFIKYYDESNTDYIIMDNMKIKGYTIHNRLDVISLEYAELCIKQLAKFHSLSYVLKIKRPEYYENTINILNYPMTFNTDWDEFMDRIARKNLDYLDDVAKMKLDKAISSDVNRKYKYFLENSDCIKCLCHGDFRTGNMLQRTEDDAIVEIIPIDYQVIHCGSPVNDFMIFIFGATDREFRRCYLEHLKNLYFNTVEQFLKRFSIDVEDVCPRIEFERIYKERLYFGLALSLSFIQFNLIEDGEYPDFSDLSKVNLDNKSEKVKSRVQGAIQDFIDWGYL